jgi:phospholipid/cholesterol/gamma-HCH transport system substrate-binding protein
MAARANYVKVGLFVILGLIALLGLAVGFGATRGHRDTVAFFTFFNESVQGLDVGAPVTFRGVRIGAVSGITIAPDHRMVEVRSDIDVGSMERLGFWEKGAFKAGRALVPPPPDLRAQLGSQGLTGVKYVLIDFFDPKTNPPPELSFPTPEHYLPAAKSLSKGLEDSVTKAMDRLTELGDMAVTVMGRVDRILADLEQGRVGEEAAQAVRHAEAALGELDRMVKGLNHAKVAESTGATVEALRIAIERFGKVLDRLDGDNGLVATTQRSVASFGEVGRNVTGTTRDLDQTLTEIREAATSIRLLADELEREPDALLKGRPGGATP